MARVVIRCEEDLVGQEDITLVRLSLNSFYFLKCFVFIIFRYAYACVSVWEYVHMIAGIWGNLDSSSLQKDSVPRLRALRNWAISSST